MEGHDFRKCVFRRMVLYEFVETVAWCTLMQSTLNHCSVVTSNVLVLFEDRKRQGITNK